MLEEKDRIGRSLGAIKDPKLLKEVLQFSISDDVRSQDSVFIIIAVGLSKVGREVAWNFFKDNKDLFKERYPVYMFCNCHAFNVYAMCGKSLIFKFMFAITGWWTDFPLGEVHYGRFCN